MSRTAVRISRPEVRRRVSARHAIARDPDRRPLRQHQRLVPDIVGLWRADAALEDLARLFATTLESAADLAAGESLVFLAHSMGGLVLQRALLNQPSLRDRARHVLAGHSAPDLSETDDPDLPAATADNLAAAPERYLFVGGDPRERGIAVQVGFRVARDDAM